MPTTTICMPSLSERHDVLERLRQLLGPAYVLTAAADTALYLTDWRGRYRGAVLAVLRQGPGQAAGALAHLGQVHGAVGVGQQCLGVFAMLGVHRQPDGRADAHRQRLLLRLDLPGLRQNA